MTDWESEGYDRDSMHLPRATNKLVSAVLEVNKNTVIVIISGTPVAMPWVESASTIVQSFYAGGEAGHGLADVLFGKVNPSSRLPLTFPIVSSTSYLKDFALIFFSSVEGRGLSRASQLPRTERKGPLL